MLRIEGRDILALAPPEEPGGPLRISGEFFDANEKLLFRISENEWFGPSDMWDIETEGTAIVVRRGSRDIALQLRVVQDGALEIERLNVYYRGTNVYADRGCIRVGTPFDQPVSFRGRIKGGECCIDIWRADQRTREQQGNVLVERVGGYNIGFGMGAAVVTFDMSVPAR